MAFIPKVCDAYNYFFAMMGVWSSFVVYKFGKHRIQRNEEDINGKCVVVTGGSSGNICVNSMKPQTYFHLTG